MNTALTRRASRCHQDMGGYAYLEVLIAAVVLSVALVPASDALREVVSHTQQQRDLLSINYNTQALFETVLTNPYTTLAAEISVGSPVASRFSDPAATLHRRIVYILPFDADNADSDDDHFTGAESNLLQIQIVSENTGIEFITVMSQPS